MTDAAMKEAWSAADSEERWRLFRIMTPAQKRELVDLLHRNPVLHPFLESQERVEITMRWGDRIRCYVGRSTGWRPAYLALPRRDSRYGSGIIPDAIVSIRGLGVYR